MGAGIGKTVYEKNTVEILIGGVGVEHLSDDYIERNMKQFHLYAIRTLRFAALAAHSDRTRRAKREITFSDLSRREANRINATETTSWKDTIFCVLGYEILVQDVELAEALKQHLERSRDIILLKYFLNWSDRIISEAHASFRTTVNYNRHAYLITLRKVYEGDAEWG